MATQCRSSKCTAERKGFRRELDSWRHKLIHCVGFESILEGIYGPMLLRDLSIFEDCEPEDIDDWSEDARCSFCNLHLEKLSDHNPTVASPQSPPCPDTPPPQGQSNTEKVQCQADRFLNTVFCKKDSPRSCDGSIPHVARELMRKMIHQFAIEYASKSQQEGKNGFSVDSVTSAHCSVPEQPHEDGPLDLTVTRGHLEQDHDGVLDLSRKKMGGSSNASSPKTSGSPKMHEDKDQEVENKDASWIKSEDRSTVLEMVLSTLCPYHKRLLHCILKFVHEDYTVSLGLRDSRCVAPSSECRCSHDRRKLCEDGGSRTIACCQQSCQLTEKSDTSRCDCVKNLHIPACPSVSLSCIKKVCTTSSDCECHQETMSCTYHTCKDQPCAMHSKTMESITSQTPHQLTYLNTSDCCHSPPPPPLSPMPLDTNLKIAESHSVNESSECKPHCMDPPCLEEETGEFTCLVEADQMVGCTSDGKQDDLNVEGKKSLDEHDSLMGDFMDRITEKLKSITEEKKCDLPDSPSSDSKDDIHFKEIITKVLHSSNENDYDLNKLLQQHEGDKNKSPQTRSRSRQEMMAAMSRSPDQPSIRRQNLQIKMDIARLTPPTYKKRLGKQKRKIENKESESVPQLNIEGQLPVSVDVQVSKVSSDQQKSDSPRDGQEKDNCDLTMENGCQEGVQSIRRIETVLPQNTQKCVPLVDTVETTRARRNIVPPQRFSSYVTEPRKMYFAACFSENIFIRQTPKDIALKDTTTTIEVTDTSTEINQKVLSPKHDTGVCPNVKLPTDQTSMDVDSTTATAPCPKEKETNQSFLKKIPEEQGSPQKDTSPVDDLAINTDEQLIDCQNCPSELHYSSPIKLMFVSPVVGEEGMRYVLKSASSNLSKGEEFDPCESASWGTPDATKNTEGIIPENSSPKPVENEQDENSISQNVLASNKESLFVPASNEVHIRDVSPVKRRPGRPKKLGPQIPKPAKRPIGRPPKHKIVDPGGGVSAENDMSVRDKPSDASCGDDGSSKNLKITVVYGRSRRSRRLVSESHEQTDYVNEVQCQRKHSEPSTMNTPVDNVGNNGTDADSLSETPKEQTENLNFVRPVKERKCTPNSKSHIKCQKRIETGAIRKPGRPPKVKISGISVTVTTVSPRQRKIRMNREMKDSPPRRRYLLPQYNKHTEASETKNIMDEQRKEISDISGQERVEVKTPEVGVRHSVRERKPSIYLLHSVATSRSFSHSNALLRRSRQVLLNKANSEYKKLDDLKGTTNNALSINHTVKSVANMKDLSQFSDISMDSIFTSSEPLEWWPTSASPTTLNEESDRRIKLISNTWISGITENDCGDLKPQISSKANCSETTPVSAVKMLFDKHYNMDNLCTWFMQTTETQSLAIVKKVSARNPYEIMHSNPFRVSNRTNVCPSPQSESLRKPVKKFAKVVPKTPKTYQQAQVIMCNSIQANHILLKRSKGKMPAVTQSGCLKTWEKYRNTLQRVRSKFDSKISQRARSKTISDVNTESEVSLVSNLLQTTVDQGSVPPQTVDTLTTSLNDEGMNNSGPLTKEERISSKAWSAESLKECRVFLKKINSPGNKLTAEECKICTVEPCRVMPSRYSTTAEHNKLERLEAAEGLRSPSRDPLKPHSLQKEQQVPDRGVTTGKHKSLGGSESPPAKAARQSRRSRGLSTARWSDYILGSAK
ncbi:uncharacterized protein lcorl isoform X2 [Engraulis encrasicolus]|uniref:uncharacterized protein lcorl isoform X2 n=1 Tax=Engraulis encrasicolus TaxID=184585 RepID=UPI002FCEE0A9